MKILILHNSYLEKGGEDSVVDNEFKLLSEIGHDVRLFKVTNPINIFLKMAYIFFSPFNPYWFFKIKKLVRKEKPDLVHLHNWHFTLSPSVIWSVKSENIKLVQTIHNYRILCPSAYLFHKNKLFLNSLNDFFFQSAIKNRVYRDSSILTFVLSFTLFLNRFIGTWSKVDKFVFLNSFMADLHSINLNLLPDRVFIKPNFVNSGTNFKRSGGRSSFVFVGRLSEEKGIRVLLEPFCKSDQELLIIGDGPLRNLVEEMSLLHNNIIYLGFKSKKDLIAILSKAKALIFPSIWYEGMPMTILESFSVGTPVISSNLGSLSSMIVEGQNGFLFEAGNTECLLKTIVRFDSLDDLELDELCTATRNYYNHHFTKERNVVYFESLFKILEE